SHEVISAGFWAGSGAVQEAAFYAYAAPEPAGLRDLVPQPSSVYYHPPMGIFILPYAAVRTATSPVDALLAFLQSTYDAAADLAHWDRAPREPPVGGNLADSFRVVADRLAQLEEGVPRRHPHPAPDERVSRSDLEVEPGAPLPTGPAPHGARAVPVIKPARRVRLVGRLVG